MSDTRYNADAFTVEKLLAPDSASFQIPPFQRSYSWNSEKVAALLADLYQDMDWKNQKTNDLPYFIGAIVLSRGDGESELVLDGQQRLCTLSLLLAVLKVKLSELNYSDTENIKKYLESGKLGQKKTPKLKMQSEDKEIYSALINDPSKHLDPKFKNNLLSKSVTKIYELTEEFITNASKQGVKRIDALEALTNKVIYRCGIR